MSWYSLMVVGQLLTVMLVFQTLLFPLYIDYAIQISNWIRVLPPEQERNTENEFTARNVGIKNCPPRNSRPIEYFYLFFTNFIWDMLVRETNAYADETLKGKRDSGGLKQYSRLQKWVEVTTSEMKKYVALILNMGFIRMKNVDYWSTKKNRYIAFFSNIMSVNRFQLISSMIHLSSNKQYRVTTQTMTLGTNLEHFMIT